MTEPVILAITAMQMPDGKLAGRIAVVEPNGETWELECEIDCAGKPYSPFRIRANTDVLPYLEQRYGDPSFGLKVANVLREEAGIPAQPMPGSM